jgi:hypothetical protein
MSALVARLCHLSIKAMPLVAIEVLLPISADAVITEFEVIG